jgi:hypothetical protein
MRKLFIIALLGMLCGSAFGAANGSCTGTTSCTLSGTPTATSLQIYVRLPQWEHDGSHQYPGLD